MKLDTDKVDEESQVKHTLRVFMHFTSVRSTLTVQLQQNLKRKTYLMYVTFGSSKSMH